MCVLRRDYTESRIVHKCAGECIVQRLCSRAVHDTRPCYVAGSPDVLSGVGQPPAQHDSAPQVRCDGPLCCLVAI